MVFTYFTAAGGCFGLEPTVYSAGAPIALIFIFIIPFVTSLPVALIAAEMCSFYPEQGSTILWCNDIYEETKQYSGAKWKKILSWCFSQFNCNTLFLKAYVNTAIYASMCFNYISALAPVLQENIGYKIAIGAGLYLITFILNSKSLKMMGNIQIAFSVLTIIPILIAMVCGFMDAHPENLSFTKQFSQIDWQLLLSTIIWNTTGLDSATNVSSNVKNPEKTYPRALVLTVVWIVLSYFLPVLSFCLNTVDENAWMSGFGAVVDQFPVGQKNHWLKLLVSIAGIVAVFALLINQVGCAIRELQKSAEYDKIPFLSKHYANGCQCKNKTKKQEIPIFALFTVCTIPILLLFLPHETIVSLDGYLICFTALTQVVAYVYCRHGQYSIRNIVEGLMQQEGEKQQSHFEIKNTWLCTILMIIAPVLANLFGIISGGLVFLGIFIGAQAVLFILQIIYLACTHNLSQIVGNEQEATQFIQEQEIVQKLEGQNEIEDKQENSVENTDQKSSTEQDTQLETTSRQDEILEYSQSNQNQ